MVILPVDRRIVPSLTHPLRPPPVLVAVEVLPAAYKQLVTRR
jgi:hypothetical protein